jgi:serine/threonine protein phosphatase PrpC
MKCPNCGHENRDVARFCQHCGAILPAHEAAQKGDALAREEQGADADEAARTATTEDATWVAADAVDRAGTEQPVGAGSPAAPDASAEEAMDLTAGLENESEGEALPPEGGWPEPPASHGEQPADAAVATAAGSQEGTVVRAAGAGTEGEASECAAADLDAPLVQEPPAGAGAPEEASAPEGETPPDEGAYPGEAALGSEESAPGEEDALAEAELDDAEAEELLVPITGDQDALPAPPDDVLAAESELRDADVLPWRDGPPPADVLAAGDVIDGRYRVIELLSIDEDDVLYSARDLQRCPQCGFDENSPDQAFCTACGAVMDQKPIVSVLQRPADREETPDVELLDHLVEGDHAYWVWEEPGKQTDVLGGSEEPMRMLVGQRTHPGRTRELDEDSLFAITMSYTYESVERASGLFIVADGMGGHEAGELASRIGIRAFAGAILRDVLARELAGSALDEDGIVTALERAMQAANEQVFLERERRENDMGTTITAALLRDWTLYLAHVGDCRAYRWGEDGLQQLTTDHSVIASMVASGTALPDQVYTHPHRSVIYRCVGDQPHVVVDTAVLSIEPGDRLVICCDGLWEMLREEGIEDVLLREADPQRACNAMVSAANEAGGPDNISVIVVQV